ncbi:hypothetical protein CIPAW_01G037300 [Carya illinoinensis]|uniref:Uncharacterized protein n=1 Tax=Carya illinoinensis TaxID=32201 RepID=A0A8T1RJK5_CARIL|nr:hypothetical protein CIPAW_01G037300 [Carya illinoinensis]
MDTGGKKHFSFFPLIFNSLFYNLAVKPQTCYKKPNQKSIKEHYNVNEAPKKKKIKTKQEVQASMVLEMQYFNAIGCDEYYL